MFKITRLSETFPSHYDNIYESEALPNKFASVPIYKDKVQYVQKRIFESQLITTVTNESSNADQNALNNAGDNGAYELRHFLEAKDFTPRNLVEELFDICILGFKNLTKEIIEQLLLVFVGDGIEIKWTCLDDVEEKVIFLRVLDKEDLKKSSEILRKCLKLDGFEILGNALKIGVENKTREFVDDTLGKEQEPTRLDEVTKEEITKIIDSLLESSDFKTSVGNVDELDYVIDENELRGLPLDQLPQLRKDVKEFRLKVLENEKKKREKDSQDEIKRSKQQLRKLFEKSKNNGDVMDSDDEDEDEGDEGYEGDGDDLSDEQFEQMRLQKEHNEMLKNYTIKLTSVKAQQHRNLELISLFEKYSSYEDRLDKTLKPEYEQGKFQPSYRDKLYEAQKDDDDRVREIQEKETKKQKEHSLTNVNIPLKVNLTAQENDDEDEEHEESEVNADTQSGSQVGGLSIDDDELDRILEKIKPKIEEYIEEFLGVKEDELLEYITMIIKDTKSKEALIEELKETFDDDALKIGNNIWQDIGNQSI